MNAHHTAPRSSTRSSPLNSLLRSPSSPLSPLPSSAAMASLMDELVLAFPDRGQPIIKHLTDYLMAFLFANEAARMPPSLTSAETTNPFWRILPPELIAQRLMWPCRWKGWIKSAGQAAAADGCGRRPRREAAAGREPRRPFYFQRGLVGANEP